MLKLLLDNINCLPPKCSTDEGDDPSNVIGWTLVLVLSLSLFFRAVLFNLSFKIGLRTALRFELRTKQCLGCCNGEVIRDPGLIGLKSWENIQKYHKI